MDRRLLGAGLMLDLIAREQRLTAQLVRARLVWLGVAADLGYTGDTIWLQDGEDVVSCIAWPRWWDAGLATREDRAIQVAARLGR